mmetsp:Transcript_1575/g.4560  ORF Transcript_1575/g.4560 Transcript_1575/m.4560 type:complete len:381 (-) Transcript_1575:333-1475(-)|eukprot:CAMPEP_0117664584 /NCGR_PEP_ID=MMETSP0804-20121206/9306_1 /TAXON_ID=1074897 /ORGANISM="Tetraselmis astigmatica, Strain CCMP880" /LENGTH=380 /DNA_ID=CAMNT_0005471843 /DNA_START=453 /DNA_END=1595 /DNA_ORIENTATION=+
MAPCCLGMAVQSFRVSPSGLLPGARRRSNPHRVLSVQNYISGAWGPKSHKTCLVRNPRNRPGLQHRAAVDSKVEAEGIEEDNQKPEPLELPMNEIDALNRVGNTESSGESVAAWVGAAMLFGVGVGYFLGVEKAQEYFAGYLLEQSLSVDNLFVFILIFKFFKVEPPEQEIVLGYGIWTAAVLRLVMTIAGAELVANFKPILLVFALILLYSSISIFQGGDEEEDGDLKNNSIVQFCRKLIKVSDHYDGNKFFTTENGVRIATPLLLVLAIVELSDVVFAVDSIPAVFGVTVDPFIVYSSNMFAIANLRSLYTFVAVAINDLHYLEKSVALVLAYIGTKMVVEFAGVEIPTSVSLGIVASVLAAGVGLSYVLPPPKPEED